MLILKLRNLWMATNSFKLLSIISRAVNLKLLSSYGQLLTRFLCTIKGGAVGGGGGVLLSLQTIKNIVYNVNLLHGRR